MTARSVGVRVKPPRGGRSPADLQKRLSVFESGHPKDTGSNTLIVGAQGQRLRLDILLEAGPLDELAGKRGVLAVSDHPPDHVPAEDVDQDVEVVARPLGMRFEGNAVRARTGAHEATRRRRYPSGLEVAGIPAGNRLRSYRTARPAIPADSSHPILPYRNSGERAPTWREAARWSPRN